MELIDRERLIDEVVKLAKTSESDWRGIKFSASEIKFIIERQKPIESRQKGKWEKYSNHRVMGDGYLYNCSECGEKVYVDSGREFPNFCERCGTDMRGDE